jgi:hypothetical protein
LQQHHLGGGFFPVKADQRQPARSQRHQISAEYYRVMLRFCGLAIVRVDTVGIARAVAGDFP